MAEQYVSIKTIQDKLTKHPLLQGVTLESVIDYTVDFMRIVGVPNIFVNKVITEHTDNYKIKLPCDYVKMLQMRGRHGVYKYGTHTFHLKEHKHHKHISGCDNGCVVKRIHDPQCDACEHSDTCDHYQFDYNKTECICMLRNMVVPDRPPRGNYYVTQNNYIYLSNKVDTVDISYYAILTDGDGYPMIPDNSKFIRALIAYIKKEYFTILFDLNSISQQSLMLAQQDYAWAVGACESDMHEFDLPKLEMLSNAMHGMVNKNNEYHTSFGSNGDAVIFKTH